MLAAQLQCRVLLALWLAAASALGQSLSLWCSSSSEATPSAPSCGSSTQSFMHNGYVALGLAAGSCFGTSNKAPTGFPTAQPNGRVGLIGDVQDGSNNMFDWISHSSPTEGGVVQWTEQSTQKSYAMVAAAPLGATRLLRTFSPSNRAASLIDVWTLQGVGANPVKLMVAYEAGAGQQYMKVAVTIVNTAATPLLDMYYERLLKPSSTTKTWVRYQPFTSDGLGTLVHPTLPHASAVVSLTTTGENSVVMVGYSNQTRVNWATSQNVNPYQTFGTGPNTLQDYKTTAGYGPPSSSGSYYAYLTTHKPSLAPGEALMFEYGYAFSDAVADDELLPSLAHLEIISPTVYVSGASFKYAIRVDEGLEDYEATFYLYVDATQTWHTLGTATTKNADQLYEVAFDTSLLSTTNSVAHLQVEVMTNGGYVHRASRIVEILTAGPDICFNDAGEAEVTINLASTNLLSISQCSTSSNQIDKLSCIVESYVNGQVMSTGLPQQSSGSPLQCVIAPGDLDALPLLEGDLVSIRAVAFSAAGIPLSTAVVPARVILNINNPPTDILLDATTVDENMAAGYAVGLLTTVDLDPGQTFTYSLVSNPESAFAVSGSVLVTNKVLNFEAGSSYTIRIRSDDGEAWIEKNFVIQVNDKNDPPTTASPTSVSVPETQPVGLIIEHFVATDEDDGDVLEYFLSNDFGKFALNSETGELSLIALLDFEERASYTVLVLCYDQQGSFSQTEVIVTVEDVNEPPVNIQLECPGGACQVQENAAAGLSIGNLSATDPDQDDSHRFELVTTAYSQFFEIQGMSLVLKEPINYEVTGSVVQLTIRVFDSGDLAFTKGVVVEVIDVVEGGEAYVTVCDVDEDRKSGDTLTAPSIGKGVLCQVARPSDADAPIIEAFSIRNDGENGNDDSVFRVDSCSGIVFVNNSVLDYETTVRFNVTLTMMVADSSEELTGFLIVNVRDINEAPAFTHTLLTANISENLPPQSIVVNSLLPFVQDPDFEPQLRFTITSGNIGDAFTVELSTGAIKTAKVLNFESRSQYQLLVRVDDGSLTDEVTVEILVTDVNEAPVLFTSEGSHATIAEHSSIGTIIQNVIVANDPDVGQQLSYEISGGNKFDAFALTTVNQGGQYVGQLSVTNSSALDFERVHSYNLSVTVTDSHVPPASSQGFFIISLTNVNEPPTIEDVIFSVPEDAVKGTLVGQPMLEFSSDSDADSILSFEIASFGGDSLSKSFALSGREGQLSVAAPFLSFELTQFYTYQIRATDQFGLSAIATVLIEVLDVPEPPVIMGTTVGYVPENDVFPFCLTGLPLDVTPLAITAGDDDGDDVTFTLLSIDGDVNSTLFALKALPDNRSVNIWAHAAFDYEQADTFTLLAAFTDGMFVEEAVFTVKVVDMNDPPIFPAAEIHCDVPMTAIEGDMLCKFSVEDQDSPASGFLSLQYDVESASVVSDTAHLDANVSQLFAVHATGDREATLSLAGPLVLDTGEIASLVVAVTDGGGAVAYGTIEVTIIHVNRAPECPSTPITLQVEESLPSGSFIADLGVKNVSGIVDLDGDMLNFTGVGTDAYAVKFVGSSMYSTMSFDMSTKSQYIFSVVVTDPEGLEDECLTILTVTNQKTDPRDDDGTGAGGSGGVLSDDTTVAGLSAAGAIAICLLLGLLVFFRRRKQDVPPEILPRFIEVGPISSHRTNSSSEGSRILRPFSSFYGSTSSRMITEENAKENFVALFTRNTFWALEPEALFQRLEQDNVEARRLPEIEGLHVSALDILTLDSYGEQKVITKGQLIKFKKYLETHGREYYRFVLNFFVTQPHGAVPLKDLTWVELLGSGGFGSVHRVRNRLNGDEYAIKLIYFEVGLAALSEEEEEEEADEKELCIPEAKLLLDRHFLREVESQQRVHHPYVCSIQSGHWGMTETQGWILMTYCPNGSLRSLMRNVAPASVYAHDPALFVGLMKMTLEGIAALHAENLIHRDIKPENILLGPNMTPLIADFGLARKSNSSSVGTAGVGTFQYMAPELHRGQVCTPACDIWSFGIVMYEMALCDRPDLFVLSTGEAWNHAGSLPANIVTILKAMLSPDAESRPSARQLLDMIDQMQL